MKCTRCGSLVGPTDQTCTACGAAVVTTPPVIAQPPAWTDAAANPWAVPPPGAEWNIPQGPDQQAPAQPYAYGLPTNTQQAGSGYSIAAIICGAIAFVFCPLVLGIAGLVLASRAAKRGESLAGTARIVATLGLVVGLLLGALVVSRM